MIFRTALGFAGFVAALSVCASPQARAQPTPPAVPIAAPSAQTSSAPVAQLPFFLESNHIVVTLPVVQAGIGSRAVSKNTPPFRLILDTGADFSLIAQEAFAARKLAIAPQALEKTNVTINGTGDGAALSARFVRGVEFDAGGLTLRPQTIVAPLGLVYQFGVDGILGAEIFRAYVVEVDYEKRIVRFFDPKTYAPPGKNSGFTRLPISFVGKNKRPVVPVEITPYGFAKTTARLTLDTGSTGTFSFAAPFVQKHGWEKFAPQTTAGGGIGIGGKSNERRGRLKSADFGGITLAAPYADFSFNTRGAMASGDSDGLLGGQILRRFTIIMDYKNAALYLKPNAEASDAFPFRNYGWILGNTINASGGVPILFVAPEGVAGSANIKVGEFLFGIDGKTTRSLAESGRDALRDLLSTGTKERTLVIGNTDGSVRREVRVLPVTL